MESIQLAQMLADISDLSAADARAAAALVNANKALPTIPPSTSQARSQNDDGLKPLRPTTSAPGNRLDQLGRRVLTPPLTRSNSNQGSMPGTPREHPPGDDVDRASTLMALYEIRNKLKQQDNTSLIRAREKIDAMIAKHKATEQPQQQHGRQGDASQGPERPRLTSRYTFPKADPTNMTVEEK